MSTSIGDVLKGTGMYTLASVLARSVGFLVIPLYVLAFSRAEYGVMGILDVVVSIGAKIVALGLVGVQTRRLFDRPEDGDADAMARFICSANLLMLVAWGILTALLVAGLPLMQGLLDSKGVVLDWRYVLAITATLGLIAFKEMTFGYFVAIRRYATASIFTVVQSLAFVGFLYLFLQVFKAGVPGRYFAQALGCLLLLACLYIPYLRPWIRKGGWSSKEARFGLIIGAPVIFHMICNEVITASDRYVMLGMHVPLEEIGAYTLGYQLGMGLSLLTHSFNKAWVPNYYRLADVPDDEARQVIGKACAGWVLLVGGGCLTICFLSEPLVYLLASEGYVRAIRVLPLICVSYYFHGLYMMYVNPVLEEYKTGTMLRVTLTVAGVNIVANILLVPEYGIFGAAASTLGCGVLQAALIYRKSRLMRGRLYSAPLLWGCGLIVLCSGCVYALPLELRWLIKTGIWFTGCALLVIINQKAIRTLLDWVFKKVQA